MRRGSKFPWTIFACVALSAPTWANPFSGQPFAIESRSLSFGAIAASISGGIVTVDAAGNQTCLGLRCLGGARSALFRLSGMRDFSVSISISPAFLTNNSGDQLVVTPIYPIRSMTMHPSYAEDLLPVGGELRLAPNQPPGAYVGNYEVMLAYE